MSNLRSRDSADWTTASDPPRRAAGVRFRPDAGLVTAIHTRPRTPEPDVANLYYGARDVRRFKREFERMQKGHRRQDELCRLMELHFGAIGSSEEPEPGRGRRRRGALEARRFDRKCERRVQAQRDHRRQDELCWLLDLYFGGGMAGSNVGAQEPEESHVQRHGSHTKLPSPENDDESDYFVDDISHDKVDELSFPESDDSSDCSIDSIAYEEVCSTPLPTPNKSQSGGPTTAIGAIFYSIRDAVWPVSEPAKDNRHLSPHVADTMHMHMHMVDTMF